jgi:hypothetical protein
MLFIECSAKNDTSKVYSILTILDIYRLSKLSIKKIRKKINRPKKLDIRDKNRYISFRETSR